MEKNEEIKEDIEVETLHQAGKPTVGSTHEWRQQGGYLNCFSCESPHGFWVGINKVYKGKDNNGNLIIEDKF